MLALIRPLILHPWIASSLSASVVTRASQLHFTYPFHCPKIRSGSLPDSLEIKTSRVCRTPASLCNCPTARSQIGQRHGAYMLQAFTLLNHTKLESELNTVHNTLCYCSFSSVPLTQAGTTSYTIRSPAQGSRGRLSTRSVSPASTQILNFRDRSASSLKQPRSKITKRHIISFGRLHHNPVSSTQIAT